MELEELLRRVSSDISHESFTSMKLICLSARLIHPVDMDVIGNCHHLFTALHRRGVFSGHDTACLRMLLRSEKLQRKADQLGDYERDARNSPTPGYATGSRTGRQLGVTSSAAQTSEAPNRDVLSQPLTTAGRELCHPSSARQKYPVPFLAICSDSNTDLKPQHFVGGHHGAPSKTPVTAVLPQPGAPSGFYEHDSRQHGQKSTGPTSTGSSSVSKSSQGASSQQCHPSGGAHNLCRKCHSHATGFSTMQGYYLRHQKGLVLVVNMRNFATAIQPALPDRLGSEKDVDRLREVFGDFLGYRVVVRENLCKAELLTFLKSVASENHIDNDCLVCFFMTHGYDDILLASDGQEVPVTQIVQIFKNCEELDLKPKLFFIQACRGSSSSSSSSSSTPRTSARHAACDEEERTCDEASQQEQRASGLCNDSDILIGWPTVPQQSAYRYDTGSPYIQNLCNRLMELVPRHENIHDILAIVGRNVGEGKERQTPMPSYTLQRRFEFPCPRCRECPHTTQQQN